MKKVFNKCFIILGVILNIQMVNAQRVALKSNLIDWATLSPNLAVEMRLNQRLTLDISAAANPFSFTIADMKATHFRFQPELRYWFNRPMARHFMGISLLGGLYNVKLKNIFMRAIFGPPVSLTATLLSLVVIGIWKLRWVSVWRSYGLSIIGKERKNRQHPIFPNGRLSLFGWACLSLIYLSDFN